MGRVIPLKEPSPCYYCGQDATGYDHVIPYCVVGHNTDLVPCCPECNSLLGSTVYDDALDKKLYIATRLKDRYRKLLRMKDFSEDELNSFTGMLGIEIREEMIARKAILQRIAFAEMALNFRRVDNDRKDAEKEQAAGN
jgi:hypothetical protein